MWMEGCFSAGLCIALIAFAAEYVDSTLGMGYGTTLTPVLLLMGYEPAAVVPAVLLSELFTGLLAGAAHHGAGNANFRPKWIGLSGSALPRDLRIVLVIAGCGVLGSLAAVFLAISMNPFYLKLYIGGMVLAIGVYILLQPNKQNRFSWKRIMGLGLVASFNKGISGGGYGPVWLPAGRFFRGWRARTPSPSRLWLRA